MIEKLEYLRKQYTKYKAHLNSSIARYAHENTSHYTKRTEYNAYMAKFYRQAYGKPLLRVKRTRNPYTGYANTNNNN